MKAEIYVSKKVLAIILVVCLAVLAFTTYMAISNTIKFNSFASVEAEITDITFNQETPSNCFVRLKYEYDGREYTSGKELNNAGQLRKGDIITIKCNPNNPQETDDNYGTFGYIVVSCFMAIFSGLLIIGLLFGKRTRNNHTHSYDDFISKKKYF